MSGGDFKKQMADEKSKVHQEYTQQLGRMQIIGRFYSNNCDRVLSYIDRDGNGKIDFNEFQKFVSGQFHEQAGYWNEWDFHLAIGLLPILCEKGFENWSEIASAFKEADKHPELDNDRAHEFLELHATQIAAASK